MAPRNQNKNELNLKNNIVEVMSEKAEGSELLAQDPQVKVPRKYRPRRSYDVAYKLRILSAYDACDSAAQRGELLRKEGLYYSCVLAWKKQQENAQLSGRKQASKLALRTDYLDRENAQLKKKLAQAEAIIELQKKVSELLTSHILPHESSDLKS